MAAIMQHPAVNPQHLVESPPRAWAEIDLGAMLANLHTARAAAGCELMVVVKAGAYGHGLEEVARLLAKQPIAFLGVAHVGEARRIRAAGVDTPIYLLGPTWQAERAEIVAKAWTPCVSSIDEAADFNRLAAAAGVKQAVHLAVDTGMGRGGFVIADLPQAMQALDAMKHLEIEGIGSHLPSADEDEIFTRSQIDQFERLIESLGGASRFKWRHLLNSAGLTGYPRLSCNLARPGLMLYGVSSLPKMDLPLATVMTLKSRITLLRTLPPGHGISYGRAYVTQSETRVATVGIGYGDGYPRHISGQGGEVVIRKRRCPILGRVTMDQLMVDVSALPDAAEGDEVELFGPSIPVTELATKAATIPWEIFTGITPRVARHYLNPPA
ncbi:MAG: alanine racemase [Luteolibacter sp.]